MKRIATLALLAASMAFAQTPATSPTAEPARRPKPVREMVRRLGLSEAQKQEAKALFRQSRQNAEPIEQQLKKNREALAAAYKANDQAQIRQLTSQQGNLRGELLAMRSQTRARFLATLTPEQRAKADQAREPKLKPRIQRRFKG
jgi:Spy/CpxP family protein refolding chaperone